MGAPRHGRPAGASDRVRLKPGTRSACRETMPALEPIAGRARRFVDADAEGLLMAALTAGPSPRSEIPRTIPAMDVRIYPNSRRPGVGLAARREGSRPLLPQHARHCPVLEAGSALGFMVYAPLEPKESLSS